ncbi:hypothetical protein, partial [Pseudomonas sp. GM84]|uniref:hypothetical protein n=1 Tax=Pseudomonas sp. GM84 TaxID=1144340 RepID=UPI001EE667F0
MLATIGTGTKSAAALGIGVAWPSIEPGNGKKCDGGDVLVCDGLFAGQARSHRFSTYFKAAKYLWERA